MLSQSHSKNLLKITGFKSWVKQKASTVLNLILSTTNQLQTQNLGESEKELTILKDVRLSRPETIQKNANLTN